ncbi:unnamed protein product [Callosobruchus maculatus]|uniref:Cathepsin propeptide inhibitor domain-containing protein n=1 Tax=Callosobruchus maculatus TaxID=64391 RepID=A0A653DR05_CALMS|nr:unnamed protein product [Callosobruchus maculatus]
MKVLVVFALVLVAVQATSDEELWHQFKVEHGKTYRDLYEEKQRFTIFQSNLKTIEEHNAKYENGEESYFMKVTQFADMTPEEFQDFLLLSSKSIPEVGDAIWEAEEGVAAPASFDWREKGAVLGVKNQGACGSCWAFSATGCLEGQLAIKQKKKISLSEQNLMDCSSSYGNGACNGGLMTSAFRYVHDHGINTEADYPYETKKGSCRFNSKKSVTKVGKIYSVAKNEDALKEIIGKFILS